MLKSMTAYGRASLDTEVGHLVLEIQSVNRKFLEINVILPKELIRFDGEIKRWLIPQIARGQVTLKLFCAFDQPGTVPVEVKPNLSLVLQMKQAWDQIAHKLGITAEFDLSLLAQVEGILLFEDNVSSEELYKKAIKAAVDQALNGFLAMKLSEGAALERDILQRIIKLFDGILAIERLTPCATKKYREKLMARIEEVVPGYIENEERVLREVALFAEKIDITEEITRFNSHLQRVRELLTSSEAVGKTLEFVLQELGREINTIGSKSSDIEITNHVIDIKSELEKIREQIQNIE